MKLELKHLAPYLPYELKIRCGEISRPILTCAYTNEFEIAIKEVFINSAYKPILRPLSDLTKEIEVNGKKFVPIEFFKQEYTDHRVKFESPDCIILEDDYSLEQNVLGAPFAIIEKLFEWHFDVFGLIPLNLAININTL